MTAFPQKKFKMSKFRYDVNMSYLQKYYKCYILKTMSQKVWIWTSL